MVAHLLAHKPFKPFESAENDEKWSKMTKIKFFEKFFYSEEGPSPRIFLSFWM